MYSTKKCFLYKIREFSGEILFMFNILFFNRIGPIFGIREKHEDANEREKRFGMKSV